MTDCVDWPTGLGTVLAALAKFADVTGHQGSGTMTGAASYGFRADVPLDEGQLRDLQDLYAEAKGKPVRFALPDERHPREGRLQEPQVLGSAPDGRTRVMVTIGGGHPIA